MDFLTDGAGVWRLPGPGLLDMTRNCAANGLLPAVAAAHIDECRELSLNPDDLARAARSGGCRLPAGSDGADRFVASGVAPRSFPSGRKGGRPGKCFDEDGRYGPR
ncbi:hypothetical protein KL86PLE_40791 [uncultured Pleomorphomonas sp.]|uniref:Uncharacterized protein n=1 Tax=uncultured Pleomorphomonas sp. TaxID=442121 RepID=A0A212LHE9_9HYPH|nr:hypothetical protein KL86PLE_40791 [uncultured Pleomorphomonas sp.]